MLIMAMKYEGGTNVPNFMDCDIFVPEVPLGVSDWLDAIENCSFQLRGALQILVIGVILVQGNPFGSLLALIMLVM